MSIWNKAEKLLKPLQRFVKSERGNVAMMAGIAAIPLVITGGSAIDYERAVNAKIQLYASLDSAALYAASLTDTTDAALTTKAQIYVQQNYKNNTDATLSGFAIKNNGTTVTATANVQLHNYFMSMVGYPTTTVAAGSTVSKMGINLEVSLVLDNTGSMNSTNPQTGNSAIADLKTSAVKFVNMVMPATQGLFYTKIAAIPYNNSVNLGTEAVAATARGPTVIGTSTYPALSGFQNYKFTSANGILQNYPSTTCVTERQGPNAYNDSAFGPVVGLSAVGRFYGPPAYNGCNVTPLQPLTTSAAALNATINAMSAGGSTGGQNGVAWGWYTLSPTVGIWSGASVPAGYDKLTTTDLTQKVRKVMIMMTDAEYNSAYCNGVISAPSSISGSGSQDYQIPCSSPLGNSYVQSTAMCAAIKKSGVEVFVITFQLDKTIPQRVALTQNCATDASHIIDADATSLDAAFLSIANSIISMRISS